MNPSHLVAMGTAGMLAVAVYTDLRSRTIPDSVTVGMILLALAATWRGWHGVGWLQLAIGFAVGFGLGAAAFYGGAMGGGDAKLCSGLGAICGWPQLFEVLFTTALAGGLLALWARRTGRDSLPYAPAFAVGYAVTKAIQWSSGQHTGLWHLITGKSW